MKKTLSFMVMAFALLFAQCRRPEVKFPTPSAADEGTTVSMTVTAGPGSKTDITTAGGITWSSGDKLYVGYDSKYVGYLTLVSGTGTPTGTFSGNVTLTGISEGTSQTFHFFYLGSTERTLEVGATEATVSFASQEIHNNGGKLENANKHHVGYGTAKGTVSGGIVTGINVTLVSKVALARFSFKKGGADYTGALTLSGTNIYNSMTVGFGGSFNHGATPDNITLTGGYGERYVMLVPTGDATEQTLTFACGSEVGGGKVPGLQSNKFYGKSDAIAVSLHETVNMGLPEPYDKLEWATCNLGASKPEEYGDYYAWGATETWYSAGGQTSSPTWKPDYSKGYKWDHCPHTSGTYSSSNKAVFTKYVPQDMASTYGYNNFYDNKTVLDASDDAATVAWGSDWRMPTTEEWKALYDYTTNAWDDNYNGTGVAGLVFTSKDGKGTVLFLRAAGYREGTSLNYAGKNGYYWSGSLYSSQPMRAYSVYINVETVHPQGYNNRNYGYTVRPVRPAL